MSDMPTLFDVEPIPTPTFRRCPCCQGAGLILDLDEPIPSAPARPTDPETSHSAAKTEPDVRLFDAGSRKAQLLLVIADLGPMTAQAAAVEVVTLAKEPLSKWLGAHRRVSDLVRAGFIADSGERHFNPGSHKLSIAWEVTGRGLEALDYLDKIGRSLP